LWRSSRRKYYPTARALRSFAAADDSDWDWAGALRVAEFLDDVSFIRSFAEAYAAALKKQGRKGK
jgi:hypothetical protein